jgi:chloramphenicol 3-O phosphotransferase
MPPRQNTSACKLGIFTSALLGRIHPALTLNTREAARGDRPMGSAAQDFASVHKALRYDLQLDGTADPAMNAKTVLDTPFPPRSNFFP